MTQQSMELKEIRIEIASQSRRCEYWQHKIILIQDVRASKQLVPQVLRLCRRPFVPRRWGNRLSQSPVQRHSMMTAA